MKLVRAICEKCLEAKRRALPDSAEGYLGFSKTAIQYGHCYRTLTESPDKECPYTTEMAVSQETQP